MDSLYHESMIQCMQKEWLLTKHILNKSTIIGPKKWSFKLTRYNLIFVHLNCLV